MAGPPIGTLARGFAILQAFGAFEDVLSTSELADRTGLALPTVSRLAATLAELGLLSRTRRRGHYRVGLSLLTLSHNIQANLRSPARLHLAALETCRRFDVETCISIYDGTDMMVLEVFTPQRRNRSWLFPGDHFPMVSTATGRAYLASLDTGTRDSLVRDLCAAEPTISEEAVAAMRRAVALRKQNGFCSSILEYDEHSFAVAVPVFAANGVPAYVLTAIGVVGEVSRHWMVQEVAPFTVQAVKALQGRLATAPLIHTDAQESDALSRDPASRQG